jgi:predicted DNA-binding transcriptional regulator
MGLSIAGLLGAAVALVLGLINYRLIVTVVETRLRALDRSETVEERAAFERKALLLRRIVLWTDIVVFPFVGYVAGRTIAG